MTEKFAYERKIRESKLRTALRQSKEEIEEMKELIEKTTVEEIIQNRKRKRQQNQNNESIDTEISEKKAKSVPKFRQRDIIAKNYDENDNKLGKSALQRIFRKNDS